MVHFRKQINQYLNLDGMRRLKNYENGKVYTVKRNKKIFIDMGVTHGCKVLVKGGI